MEYQIKTDKDTASFTGRPDPSDILKDDEDEREDLAWSIAGAYSWATDETLIDEEPLEDEE